MISVIIPTLNAAQSLAATLTSLAAPRAAGVIADIAVIDGGSADDTTSIARAHDAAVLETTRGRGPQLRAGGAAATGPWLLFLHGDTALAAGWASAATEFIADPDNLDRAAYFRFRLDDRSTGAMLVEAGVHVRNALFRLPYGDQGLLISKRFYESLGGYTPIPLMEDVDFVRRIKRAGGRRALVELDADAVTSAARYRRNGYAARVARNASCLAQYYAGVAPERIAQRYER